MLVRLHTLDGFHQPRALPWAARFSGAYDLEIDADSINLTARFVQVRPAKIRLSIIILGVVVLAFAAFIIGTDGLPDYRGVGAGALGLGLLMFAGIFLRYGLRLLPGNLELDKALRPYREIALSEIDNAILEGRDVWLRVRVIESERTLILRHRRREDAEATHRRLKDAVAAAAGH